MPKLRSLHGRTISTALVEINHGEKRQCAQTQTDGQFPKPLMIVWTLHISQRQGCVCGPHKFVGTVKDEIIPFPHVYEHPELTGST